DVIPGRASLLTIPWHQDSELRILGIYAPNDEKENAEFWRTLQRTWRTSRLPKPDMMMGDFNVVEDKIDRLPMHKDNGEATEALRTLKAKFNMLDGWRTDYDDVLAYSYTQIATGAHSRIDRIYATDETLRGCDRWEIEHPGAIETDHKLVSVMFTDTSKPYIGKGRWSMPTNMIRNAKLAKDILQLANTTQKDVERACALRNRSPTWNPQTLWAKFKRDVQSAAREIQRGTMPRLDSEIARLEEQLDDLLNDTDVQEEERAIQGA
ncbi:hypothetical protein PUNSTDRAFT_17686, partial [Punctularia strigosozonata HHB-11173 SS5]|uniref:uncharacterized protein n=1 Tax=Punctularia strigosozonata (strain HHB-11173) TaxID=741275 RepID=UPI00044178CF